MSKYAGSKKREELLICQVGGSRLKQLSTEQVCQSEQEQHFIRTDVVIRFQRNTHTLQLYNQRDQEHLKTTHVGGQGEKKKKGFLWTRSAVVSRTSCCVIVPKWSVVIDMFIECEGSRLRKLSCILWTQGLSQWHYKARSGAHILRRILSVQ